MSHSLRDILRPRQQVSPQAYAIDWAMSLSVRPLAHLTVRSSSGLLTLRRLFGATSPLLARVPSRVQVLPVRTPQVRGEWVRVPSAAGSRQVVLYLHGGGYFFGSAAMHRQVTWRMSRQLRRPVLAIDYRLAPRHTFEDWRDDAVQAYQYLLARGYEGKDIVISGDSAGGHLTLVLLQTLRDRGLPMPSCGVCISPWTDLSGDSPSIHGNARRDPFIPPSALQFISRFLTRDRSPYDALVSPLHGSFTGLPPLYVLVGSTEVLRDDARRMAAKARAAGVRVHYEEWHRMPHVFPLMAAVLPEGRSAFRHIARFVAEIESPVLPLAA